MSQIFDALQRSEAERSGVDPSALSQVTKILRRAEREAAAKWEPASVEEQLDTPQIKEHVAPIKEHVAPIKELEAPTKTQTETPVATVVESSVVQEPIAPAENLIPLDEFPSLQVPLTPESKLVCFASPQVAAAEAFRLLGVRLRLFQRKRTLKKVLITSTIPQEGKSVVASNLACTLAQTTQQRVLLIEGDVRLPSLAKVLGIDKHPGLCECLFGTRPLSKSIYHLKGPDLWILPAGSAPSNPLELLQSGRLPALMDQLTAWFDWIIIDSPPVLPMADTSVWMNLADGILLVLRQGTTEKRQLQRGLEALESKKMIGAVLNCSKSMPHSDYYYGTSSVTPTSGGVTK